MKCWVLRNETISSIAEMTATLLQSQPKHLETTDAPRLNSSAVPIPPWKVSISYQTCLPFCPGLGDGNHAWKDRGRLVYLLVGTGTVRVGFGGPPTSAPGPDGGQRKSGKTWYRHLPCLDGVFSKRTGLGELAMSRRGPPRIAKTGPLSPRNIAVMRAEITSATNHSLSSHIFLGLGTLFGRLSTLLLSSRPTTQSTGDRERQSRHPRHFPTGRCPTRTKDLMRGLLRPAATRRTSRPGLRLERKPRTTRKIPTMETAMPTTFPRTRTRKVARTTARTLRTAMKRVMMKGRDLWSLPVPLPMKATGEPRLR